MTDVKATIKELLACCEKLPALLSRLEKLEAVAEAANRLSEVRTCGKVPRQVHEGEAWQSLVTALKALEAHNG